VVAEPEITVTTEQVLTTLPTDDDLPFKTHHGRYVGKRLLVFVLCHSGSEWELTILSLKVFTPNYGNKTKGLRFE
jgi:hypothetical protein